MRKYNLISGFFAALNPCLGLIFSLINFIRLRDSSIVLAFSISLIAIYFPIMYDTAVNFYQSYYSTSYGGVNNWFSLYLYIPSFFMYKFNIDFYFFIFISVFFVTYTWSKITFKYVVSATGIFKPVVILIFLLFTFNYRDLMDINRTILSYSILFYYIFLIKKHNLFKFLFFSFLSFLFHNSALLIILIYLLSLFDFKFKLNLNFLLIFFSLIIGLFLPKFITNFQSFIIGMPFFGDGLSYYLYGDDFAIQDFTLGTALKKILNVFIILLTCFLSIFEMRKTPNDKFLQFIVFTGCFCLFFLGFVTFFERINLAFNFALIYLLSKNVKSYYLYGLTFLIFIRSIAVYLLIYFPIFFGDYSLVMVNSDKKNDMIYKVLYCPSFYLLDVHNNGYSDQFILSNVRWGKL
ncbi:MAG: EpsG family protein [Acinetobacter ursingii]|nr:EpsG family protein [Acinetobacter ursingii]